jgi:hypothetical protein
VSDGESEQELARLERAAARRGRITLRRTTLGAADDEPRVHGAEAIALLADLSRAAWSMSGRPLPDASSRLCVAFVPRVVAR